MSVDDSEIMNLLQISPSNRTVEIDSVDQEAPIKTPDARKSSAVATSPLANEGISENIHLPVVITFSIGVAQADPMDTLTQQLPPSAAAAAASSQLTPISPNPPRRKSCCSLDVTSGGGGAGSLVSPPFPRKILITGGGDSSNALMTANSSHLQQQQHDVSSPTSYSLGDWDDDFDASSHEL